MSISSEIARISGNITDSLTAVASKGITVPSGSNSDDLPDLIAQIPNNYSVTLSLTGASSSATTNKVVSGGSYFTEITPTTAGHKISSITVTMGGVDITSQVFKPGVGAKAITANGTYNSSNDALSGYSSVTVNVPGGGGGSTLITKTITENGTYNASSDSADGYSSVTVNVPSEEPNLQAKTNISPSTSSQTITPDSGYDGLSSVQINAMPSGSARPPSNISATEAGITSGSNIVTLYKTVSVTPLVSPGYISSGTEASSSIALTATVPTQASQVIFPSTSDQTIASGTYISGTNVIKAVTTSNLAAENIKDGVTVTVGDTTDPDRITSVTGTFKGGSGLTILKTTSLGTLSTTSTSATDTGKSLTVSSYADYDLLIVDVSVDTPINNRHTSTVSMILVTGTSSVDTKNTYTVVSNKWNSKLNSSGTGSTRQSTTAYGIYANSASVSSGTMTIPLYYRQNSNSTGTLNGTYTARIYGMKLYDLIGG